jgi:outer membrane protein assembly factor BamA
VHYPDSYYGIGTHTTLADREELTRRFVELNASAELPLLGRRLRAGPRVHGRAEEIRDVRPGGEISAGAVPGARGFSAVGFGFTVTWDSRDRPLWPTRGGWAQATYLHYPSSIGRNDGFGRSGVEGRLFLPLGRGRVLGVAAMLEESYGETPFSLLSKLGSTRYLRGIREGRFRDALAWAAQAELRVPLASRLYGAAFGAFGDVGSDLDVLSARTLKVAGGGGLRVRLTDQGANLRFDVAASDAGPEVYVVLLEAF